MNKVIVERSASVIFYHCGNFQKKLDIACGVVDAITKEQILDVVLGISDVLIKTFGKDHHDKIDVHFRTSGDKVVLVKETVIRFVSRDK